MKLLWYFYFVKQFKGNANYNSGNPDSKKYSEASHRAYESSKSSQSCEESLSTLPSNLHHSGLKPIVDQDSDDSDSEIFRVKRRTSQKVEKREINDAMGSKHSDHQVLLTSDACIWLYYFQVLGLRNVTAKI